MNFGLEASAIDSKHVGFRKMVKDHKTKLSYLLTLCHSEAKSIVGTGLPKDYAVPYQEH
jgi:hypothetical protein